jgi:hypothetical protein
MTVMGRAYQPFFVKDAPTERLARLETPATDCGPTFCSPHSGPTLCAPDSDGRRARAIVGACFAVTDDDSSDQRPPGSAGRGASSPGIGVRVGGSADKHDDYSR